MVAHSAGRGRLFIADLHLTDLDGKQVREFVEWLAGVELASDLWILGDLFEYWLGPAHLESPGFAPVIAALAKRSRGGGFTAVVPGNRDFLLDAAFEQATGVQLFAGGAGLSTEAGDWLLLHGDELCTRDRGYQRLRKVLRSRFTRWLARTMPGWCKRALAERLRRASRSAVPRKDPSKIAMQADAAREALQHAGATTLLCGHAHGFQHRELDPGLDWWVLDAFGHGQHDVLRMAADGGLVWSYSGVGKPPVA
ncbi:MAG TPA: UDP-2,3-diacylglucosamine diphosphatase [Planctomycetota bacterium]|nr:UDP-2,3-diacylglucosamine diphosphatase [Planctomycetota bacterium]